MEGVNPKAAVAERPCAFQGNSMAQMDVEQPQIRGSLKCSGKRCQIVGWRGGNLKFVGMIINSIVVQHRDFFI